MHNFKVQSISALVVITYLLAACNVHYSGRKIPPVMISDVSETDFGGVMRIESNSVKQYVTTYGRQGWINGLEDSRPISAASASAAQLGAPFNIEPRVKDIFYNYYVDTLAPGLQRMRQSFDVHERDELIAQALNQVLSSK